MKIFSNLAIGVDGKIADLRNPRLNLGTDADRLMMDTLRRKCDVVVNGAGTLKVFRCPLRVKKRPSEKKIPRQPANAIITASGDLDPTAPFWNPSEIVRFVFTTQRGLDKALRAAKDRAFVLPCGTDSVDLNVVVERFKESGMKNVLVEGGGELMAAFLEAKLLHEMHLTLTPWALGGRDNPSLIGGPGLTDWSALKLLKHKRVKDELYLHYKVLGARRV